VTLQLENLRLYGSSLSIPRYSGTSFQRLVIQDREYNILSHTHITINVPAVHTLPSYWGADAGEWKPSRWIDENGELIQHPSRYFIVWGDGKL